MDSGHARLELEAAKQEKAARDADAARTRGLAASAATNANALKDAASNADKESKQIAAEAVKAQHLAAAAETLLKARELLVKAADAERQVAEAETQMAVAKARKAPETELQRLQSAAEKARGAAPRDEEVEQAGKAAAVADQQLRRDRDEVELRKQIGDLEASKLQAEQAAKVAEVTVDRARAGLDGATAAVGGLGDQLEEAKKRLKTLEAMRAPQTNGEGAGTPPAASEPKPGPPTPP